MGRIAGRSAATASRGPAPSPRARLVAARALEYGLVVAAVALTRVVAVYVWRVHNGDVLLYHAYALAFWTRPPLFHALPVEYPPLSILAFTLTLLPPLPDFIALYAYWMGAFVVGGYLALRSWISRQRAIAYALYLVVGAGATLLARFDIVPALVTLAALWATQRRHFKSAYLLLAAGALLKLYPLLLLPIVLIEHARVEEARAASAGRRADGARSRAGSSDRSVLSVHSIPSLWAGLRERPATRPVAEGAALCLGVVALGFAAALALDPGGALSSFAYAGARPLEIESAPATLLWLGTLVGLPAKPVFSFASLNYVGPLDAALKPLALAAVPVVCAAVYLRQLRGKLDPSQAFLACLCGVLVTNKVFSAQYLIWALPLVAVVEGLDWWWFAVCALTTLVYPTLFQLNPTLVVSAQLPLFMPTLAVRNLLLVALTLRALLRPRHSLLGAGEAGTDREGELREAAHRVTLSGSTNAAPRRLAPLGSPAPGSAAPGSLRPAGGRLRRATRASARSRAGGPARQTTAPTTGRQG